MAESKTLIVLANSVRSKPNACVAGREITDTNAGRKYGEWIRPVSQSGNGEVTVAERTLTNGKEVSVLDIVEVQLAKPQKDVLQPENWVIDGEKNWKPLGRATKDDLNKLEESPADIWLEKNESDDRVTTDYFKKAKRSLLLLKVPSVTLRGWLDSYDGKPWKRRRFIFTYGNRNYDFAFTDPSIESRFGVKYPPIDKPAYEHKIAGPCYVCMSLAHEKKNDRHFKLVAGLIDPTMLS